MKIQSLSVVAGTKACDASCPFCISKMTGFSELPKEGQLNVTNFKKAIQLARIGGCETLLVTGKGEPTLYPKQITELLQYSGDAFPKAYKRS